MANLPLRWVREGHATLYTPNPDQELEHQQKIRRTKLVGQIAAFITVNTVLNLVLAEACEILEIEIYPGTTNSGGNSAWLDTSTRQGGVPGLALVAGVQNSVGRGMKTTLFAQPTDLFTVINGTLQIAGALPQSLVNLTAYRGYLQQF